MVKDCILGSAYTYKVQEGYNRNRKEGTVRNDYRYVYSKSSIHFDSMRGKILKKLPLALMRMHAPEVVVVREANSDFEFAKALRTNLRPKVWKGLL